MSSAPFDPQLVIARLRDRVTTLQQVRGAADYAAMKTIRDYRPPEAFVILPRERGRPEAGAKRQAVTVSFGVVVATRNYAYQDGAPAAADALPLIGEIRDALIGWMPATIGGRGCTWLQGDLLDYDAGTLLWADVFETQHFIGTTQ